MVRQAKEIKLVLESVFETSRRTQKDVLQTLDVWENIESKWWNMVN